MRVDWIEAVRAHHNGRDVPGLRQQLGGHLPAVYDYFADVRTQDPEQYASEHPHHHRQVLQAFHETIRHLLQETIGAPGSEDSPAVVRMHDSRLDQTFWAFGFGEGTTGALYEHSQARASMVYQGSAVTLEALVGSELWASAVDPVPTYAAAPDNMSRLLYTRRAVAAGFMTTLHEGSVPLDEILEASRSLRLQSAAEGAYVADQG